MPTSSVKVSELPQVVGDLSLTDIFPFNDDPSGSPVTKTATVQKLADLLEKGTFARQVDNVSNLSSEEAGSGYICIVRDLDRGGIFKAVNGGSANNGTIFSSATSGWTWQRIFDGPVNVKWFGAVGDGVTDDRSAIGTAITNSGSTPIYFPEGTYILSAGFFVKSGQTLLGVKGKSVLKMSDDCSNTITIVNENYLGAGDSNITIDGLTFDGNRDGRNPAHTAVNMRIGVGKGFESNFCENITVKNCSVINSMHAACQFFNIKKLRVENNLIKNANRDGITVWRNSQDVFVKNNIIEGIEDDCIALNSEAETDPIEDSAAGYSISNAEIAGNIIGQGSNSIQGGGIRVSGSRWVNVINNIIKKTYGSGILIEGGDSSGGGDGNSPMTCSVVETTAGKSSPATNEVQTITLGGVRPTIASFVIEFYGHITDPILQSASAAAVQSALESLPILTSGDVSVTGSDGGPWAVEFTGSYAAKNLFMMEAYPFSTSNFVNVISNIVEESGSAGSGGSGIKVLAVQRNVNLSDNILKNPYSHGIEISTKTTIEGNTIHGNQNNDSARGILVNASSHYSLIIGNTIEKTGGDGIEIGSSGCMVSTNRIEDIGVINSLNSLGNNGIFIANSNTSVVGNYIRNSRQIGTALRINAGPTVRCVVTNNVVRGYGPSNDFVDSSDDPLQNTITNNYNQSGA